MEVDEQTIVQIATDIGAVKQSTQKMEDHLVKLNGQVLQNQLDIASMKGQATGASNTWHSVAKVIACTVAAICTLLGSGFGIERLVDLL